MSDKSIPTPKPSADGLYHLEIKGKTWHGVITQLQLLAGTKLPPTTTLFEPHEAAIVDWFKPHTLCERIYEKLRSWFARED